jgi:predicted NAD-dependent protein-ADP-ribosyltransferase YbiA (DUF1768 family)
MFNNIFIEYALNNPNNIEDVGSLPLDLSQMVNNLVEFGSFAYQPIDIDKKQFNNVFLFNNKSFITLENELFEDKTSDLIYRVGDETIVKVFEKNDKSFFIISNINKSDNIDYITLNNTLEEVTKLHYPNENKSKQNRLKDYGLFTQEFYLKSFNKEGIKFEPKEVKEITEKGTDTPELTTVLNTEVLSITNISEGKSEIIKLLSDISKTTASSIEDVINGNFKYDNKFLNNFTNVTFDKTNNKITITERNYLENEEQQSLSEVIPMLKEVLDDYNKNKQVEVETPIQQIYSQLGNKTQSENVILPEDLGLKFDGSHKSNMWTVLSPNFKKQYPNGVIAYRGKVDSSAIGNPFSVTNRGEDTVKQFIEWIITGNNFGVETILMGGKNYKLSDLRNEYINIIKKAKREKILYYNELGRPSHATALDYLINKYDWNKQVEVSTPQVNQNITYTKLVDRNIKLGISEKTNNSGGAKGSDAYWNYESTIIDASNMNWHNQDMVDRAKQGLEKDLVLNLLENNKQALIKDESEYAKVVSIGGKRLGKTAKNPSVINKLGRNWYQVKNSDGIYAIIENFYTRPDTGQLDMSNVSGGTGWAIAYAAEKIDGIERLIYVYNQKDSKWYKYNYNTNVFEVYNDTPVLTNKYAGIGTRNLKDNGKKAIKDVYEKTFKSQQPETQTEINIYAGTGENAELSNFAIRPFKAKEPEQEGDTVSFNSVEQAFQYFKTFFANEKSPEERLEVYEIADNILKTTNGGELRKLGKSIPSFDSKVWDENSSGYMKALMLESFIQNPDALAKLLATGNAKLTHTQDKGKWGTEFPRLLMEVRDELRKNTDNNDYGTPAFDPYCIT